MTRPCLRWLAFMCLFVVIQKLWRYVVLLCCATLSNERKRRGKQPSRFSTAHRPPNSSSIPIVCDTWAVMATLDLSGNATRTAYRLRVRLLHHDESGQWWTVTLSRWGGGVERSRWGLEGGRQCSLPRNSMASVSRAFSHRQSMGNG